MSSFLLKGSTMIVLSLFIGLLSTQSLNGLPINYALSLSKQTQKNKPVCFVTLLQKQFPTLLQSCCTQWSTNDSNEQNAQRLMVLTLLQKFLPDQAFIEYKLPELLEESLYLTQDFKPDANTKLLALQPFLDNHYFALLHHHKKIMRVPEKVLKKLLSKKMIKQETDPFNALIIWSYLKMMVQTHPLLSKQYVKYLPCLESVIKKDPISWGYFLSYQVFHETQFGKKLELSAENYSILCAYVTTANLEMFPISVTAHLFIAFKLIDKQNSTSAQKLAQVLCKSYPDNEFEKNLLLIAAA